MNLDVALQMMPEDVAIDYIDSQKEVYPPVDQVYRALQISPIDKTKVLILGQDPYYRPGQANGLSFSVNKGVRLPPSLVNIFKELVIDLEVEYPKHGDLTYWAEQGVLLLNSILTVEKGIPLSHAHKGWEKFTDEVIRDLNRKKEPVVYILWGKKAQEKKNLITNDNHLIIESVHPSPFSAHNGFFGSQPFSKANKFLASKGLFPIDWRID